MLSFTRLVVRRRVVRPRLCACFSHLRHLPDDRLGHTMPYAEYDEDGIRMPHAWGPNAVWQDYDERYSALLHPKEGTYAQRKHEDRWNWKNIITKGLTTSPVAMRGSLRHSFYATLVIAPHTIYHQNANVQAQLELYAVENLHLPWCEMVSFCEPFVQYHDLISANLLSAFGIYSTALFLLVSMRMTGALTIQRDGHASFTAMVTETVKFSQKCQLYCTDKRVAVDLTLWAYALTRATELHLQNVHSAETVRPVFEGILSTTRSVILQKGKYSEEEEAEAVEENAMVVEALLHASNKPLFILQRITTMCRDAFDRAIITNIRALIDLHSCVGAMTQHSQRCKQLQAAPEPYSYISSMKFFIQLWLFNLPLVLVPSLHLFTVPMSTAMAFFVYKLDEISAELQNPYGFDASDIAIGVINDRLQHDLSQMMLSYDPGPAINSVSADFPAQKYDNDDTKDPYEGSRGAGDWADNEKLWKKVGLGNLEKNTQKKKGECE